MLRGLNSLERPLSANGTPARKQMVRPVLMNSKLTLILKNVEFQKRTFELMRVVSKYFQRAISFYSEGFHPMSGQFSPGFPLSPIVAG